MSTTLLWHDYETFGRDPRRDRPAQFAAQRTDEALNPVGEPVTLYCQPAADALPDPDACLLTGIGPSRCEQFGLTEYGFARSILLLMSEPQTCSVGYNSLRFDDEVTRHLFWRSLLPVYDREWRNGNSRWDLINVMRLAHAIRPEGLDWPQVDGVTSFRLEALTAANGIEHGSAHDALADVHATIALARLLRQAQPKLYDYLFSLRGKAAMRQLLSHEQGQMLFHVSSHIPAAQGSCALVSVLGHAPGRPDNLVVIDLRQEPRELTGLSDEQLRERLYTSNEALQSRGLERIPLKSVALNRCPVLLPARVLRPVPSARLRGWQLDPEEAASRHQWLQADAALRARLCSLVSPAEGDPPDADSALYAGFLTDADSRLLSTVHERDPQQWGSLQFTDPRLQQLLFRFRGRNFPESLDDEGLMAWEAYCLQRLNGQIDPQVMTFGRFFTRLEQLRADGLDAAGLAMLEELQTFAESLAY